MYWTVLSSFFIRQLDPGHFSWIHGLSAFTFLTLTLGTWAALRGRIGLHRPFMLGSYLGLIGAFLGAVVVPQRDIPQLLVHRPLILAAATCAVAVSTVTVVAVCTGHLGRRRAALPVPKRTALRGRPTGLPESGKATAGGSPAVPTTFPSLSIEPFSPCIHRGFTTLHPPSADDERYREREDRGSPIPTLEEPNA